MKNVLILNYHKIEKDKAISGAEGKFCIQKNAFIQQIERIQALEIPIISLNDLGSSNLPEFSVALTFDDGNQSDIEIVFPVLTERNVNATFFPVISTIGTKGHLSWDELRLLDQKGFIVGSHSMSHKDFTSLSEVELHYELSESKKILEQKLRTDITLLALPFGKSHQRIKQLALEVGYTKLLTTAGGISCAKEVILHRWNIKSSTSLTEFDKILNQDKSHYQRKKWSSNVKRLLDFSLKSLAKEHR